MEMVEGTKTNEVILRWVNSSNTVTMNPIDTMKSVQIWRDDSLLAEINTSDLTDTLEFIDQITAPEYYRYSICQVDIYDRKGQMGYFLKDWLGGPIEGIIVFDLGLDPSSGQNLVQLLNDAGYGRNIYYAEYSSKYPLESTLEAVFVCLGMSTNKHALTWEEGQKLKDYLDMGNCLYMEGGDTWYTDNGTPVQPMFNINPVSAGSGDLGVLVGEPGIFTQGMSFYYGGNNNSVDIIDPIVPAFKIFHNQSPEYSCAVAYDAGAYRTIGTSFELGNLIDGLSPYTTPDLIGRILEFFDIQIVPVELVSFSAELNGSNVILKWKTASETNNSGYEIQKRENDSEFNTIGFIEGKGTTTEISSYEYIDKTTEPNRNYFYRLKQNDFDGSVNFSNIIEVFSGNVPSGYSLSQNYPNPFNPQTTIIFSLPYSSRVKLLIYNAIGEEISTVLNEVMEPGIHKVEWKNNSFTSGVYYYRLIAEAIDNDIPGKYDEVKKMILLK